MPDGQVSHTIKCTVSRRRPLAVPTMIEFFKSVRYRRTLHLTHHLAHGRSAIESFPSGDAAGAAVVAASLALVTGQCTWPVLLIVPLG